MLSTYPSLKKLVDVRHIIKESERTRVSGNNSFAAENYDAAVDSYTAAIKLVEPTNNYKLKGILLANRAAARMAQHRCVSVSVPLVINLGRMVGAGRQGQLDFSWSRMVRLATLPLW